MSFLPIKEENKEAPTGQSTNAPGADTTAPPQTGGSVGEESGGGPPKTSASGSPTQFGSSASKLGDYLSANAPQIGQQAETLAGNLNQQYGNLTQGITDAANQFKQSVQGGYAAANPDLVSRALQDPTAFTQNPEDVQAFQKQYNNQYSGPLAFEGTAPYSDIQGKISQAIQQGNLLGTQGGLESYLKGNAPNPTEAMSSLDALLLRGNPEAQQKINQAGGQFGNLTGQFGQATQGADQSVLDAQKAAQDAAAYARGQFDPYVQNLGQQLTDQQTKAQQDYANYNQGVQGYQSNLGDVTQLLNQFPELMQQYGTSYSGGTKFPYPGVPQFGPTPSVLTTAPSVGNVATPDQYATAAALRQLAGNVDLPLDPSQITQAGTFNVPGQAPNNQALIDALTNAQNWAANPELNRRLVVPGDISNLNNFLNQANALYGNIGNKITTLGGKSLTVQNPFKYGV